MAALQAEDLFACLDRHGVLARLEDVIRSNEAANRPKDHRTLPVLRLLLSEIQARRDHPV